MIARLVATNHGPKLTRVTPAGGDRHAIVVVSRSLYTASPPERWPIALGGNDHLQARSGTVRYLARREIASAAAEQLSGMRTVLLPEDFVRRGGLRRPGELRRRRFKPFRPPLGRRRHIAAACLTAISAIVIVVAHFATNDARATTNDATAAMEDRHRLALELASLREERERLSLAVASAERRAALSPGRLADAVVGLLAPGEKIQSLKTDGARVSLDVTTGRIGFAERLGTLAGIVPAEETLTRDEAGTTAAVRARIGSER